ncbi:MAG TPA: hypothetical protein DDX39_05165 [Bacteroidales bacterium]|nr:MAG: hypothetical protein A2W98_11015 [Bacteroidetes bacterium GWF2_33_38]HBF88015.1 hypothetical protein [Bacteroidales bacterium]
MTNEYNILINKLDSFIKKYYKNQLIRGVIFSLTIYLLSYLFFSFAEYFGHFSSSIRTLIFYGLLAVFLLVFYKYILIPILKLYNIGNRINHVQASEIISNHFTEIKDKLHNVLELALIENNNYFSAELIQASIDQKITELKPVPFVSAINAKNNYKYFRYFTLSLLFIILIYIVFPPIFTEGSQRLINYNTYYEKEAPFKFIVLNDSLKVRRGNDFKLNVKLEGNTIPNNVSISYKGNNFFMEKISNIEYSYTFKSINNPVSFNFTSNDVMSQDYKIEILSPPIILDFKIEADIPEYTKEENKVYKNTGDIVVPCGTKLKWTFNTNDIDDVKIIFNDSVKFNANKDSKQFSIEKKLMQSVNYEIVASNGFFKNESILRYTVNVIPDLFPTIKALGVNDSINRKVMYFKGFVNDDYGLSVLNFVYKNPISEKIEKIKISINTNIASQEFYYAFDFSKVETDDKHSAVEYYFEIWDNDQVNGNKSSKSNMFEFNVPSVDEIRKIEEEASKNVESKILESQKLAKDIQNDINKLREQLINKNLTEWEKNRKVEEIAKKQEDLMKLLNQVNQDNQLKNQLSNSLSEQEQAMIEKQQQIQDLLENIMTDEMKQLLEEFNKLMEEFDKEKFNELSEDMKMSYEDLSKQLERDLEMLKKMEQEQKIQNKIDDLKKLSDEQKKLAEETEKAKSKEETEKLAEDQKELNDELKKIEEDYKEIQKENQELDQPSDLKSFEEQFNEIKNEMQESQENLSNSKNSKASKNQQQSSQKMEDLAQQMQNMMQQNQSQQQSENMDDLRQIIDNLITFSFEQEALMSKLNNISFKDPKYKEIITSQLRISDNFEIIKDSLNALAMRTPQISAVINKEVLAIEMNLNKTNTSLEENRKNESATQQQYVMTSANNLALLLSEVLKQMQQQAQQQMQGSGQCSKPKPGQMPGMKQSQQSLKTQLEQMIEQMKKGQGQGNKMDKNALNKQIGKMLSEQEKFSKMLNDMKSKSGISPDAAKKLDEISKLNEQNQRDLVNKNISPQLLKRQEQILTRLLEAENSEYEREIDKKRESKEGKNEKISNPSQFFQYNSLNLKFNDLLNSSQIELNKYYQDKYQQYIGNLNDE